MKTKTIFRSLCALSGICLVTGNALAGPTVGLVLKARSAFWIAAEAGAVAAAEPQGATIITKAPPSEADIAIQIQLFNGLVAQGVDAIVLAPCSRDLLVEPVAAAVSRGVKVVIIDTMLAKDVAPVFVGTDQREAGRAAGVLLAGMVADGDVVSVFKHSQTSGATELRERGVLEKLRELRPTLQVFGSVYAGSEPGQELERAHLVLQQHPESKAILASSTPGTMAMLRALRERSLTGSIKFIGFGFNLNREIVEAIEADAMHGWVAQLPGEMGLQGVKAALALVEGKTPPPVLNTAILVITRENLHEPHVQALLSP